MRTSSLLGLVAGLTLARAAAAQAPPPPATPYHAPPGYPGPMPMAVAVPPRPHPAASVTISPLHLAMPMFELTAEFRAGERVGLAVLGGAGSIKAKNIDTRFSVWEAGAQLRYYAVGDFWRGLELGLELLYMNVSGSYQDESGVGEGIGIGPFIGYKLGTQAGFVFDAQLGVQRVGIAASSHDSSGASTGSGSEQKWFPLINLNVGWQF